jgi:hypothetical protein
MCSALLLEVGEERRWKDDEMIEEIIKNKCDILQEREETTVQLFFRDILP